MKFKLALIAFFTTVSTIALGQIGYTESLQRAVALRNTKPDSALYWVNQALLDDAIQKDTTNWLKALSLSYQINTQFGNFEKALQYTLQQEELARKNNDTTTIINLLYSIAMDQIQLGLAGDAFVYMQQALQLAKQGGIKNKNIAILYSNIGEFYRIEKQDFYKALAYNDSAIQIAKSINDEVELAFFQINRSEIFINLGEYDKAMVYAKQGQKSIASFNEEKLNKLDLAFAYECIGIIHREQDALEQAKNSLLKGLALAQEVNGIEAVSHIYQNLSITAQREGNFEEALSFFQNFKALDDSLQNQKNKELVIAMQYRFNARSSEQQIVMLEKDKELTAIKLKNQKWISYSLGILLLLFISILTIIYRGNEARKKNIIALKKKNEEIVAKNDKIQLQKQNIEAQKELLEKQNTELDQLNQENNSLIGIVAHDLKSPLNQILGLINILNLNNGNLILSQKELLYKIEEVSQSAVSLINKLLNLEALESKRERIELQIANLVPIAQKVVGNFKNQAQSKEIQLSLMLESDTLEAIVDPSLTRQVMENLVSNAIKFSPLHTAISISLKRIENNVMFSVKDQGPGIKPEEMPRLFGKFQKLSARPTAGEYSSGLGLAIVKKYVEAMGGSVRCQSIPNEGAEFIVNLPIL